MYLPNLPLHLAKIKVINKGMLKKLCSPLLILSFIFNYLPARAGVMTKLVEVDKQEPKVDCCPELDECEAENEKLVSQNNDLKSRIQKLMGELTEVREENLQLKRENSELTTKLEELRKSVVTKKEVVTEEVKPVVKKEPSKYAKKDSGTCLACHVGNLIGPVFSTPVGGVIGTVRGSVTKGSQYANSASDAMGGSLPAKVVGNLGGGIFGLVTGAVSGLVKGIVNGVRYGFTRPFSAESFSAEGPFAEFDTYNYSDY
jgi:regulator of replication initiation timing